MTEAEARAEPHATPPCCKELIGARLQLVEQTTMNTSAIISNNCKILSEALCLSAVGLDFAGEK
jgi:hypothetical protein